MSINKYYIVPERPNFPDEEVKVLDYWKKIDAFKESMRRSEGKKLYTFYDGPPFATGLPHYGHIAAGTIKVCKYILYIFYKIVINI
jgi:isoleucyl-tRNA synthetase